METTVVNGVPRGSTASITVTGSPFTWTNPESVRVVVMMSGGTLTTISLSPDGSIFSDVGLGCGHYALNPGWAIKVVYVIVPPTMSYTPG